MLLGSIAHALSHAEALDKQSRAPPAAVIQADKVESVVEKLVSENNWLSSSDPTVVPTRSTKGLVAVLKIIDSSDHSILIKDSGVHCEEKIPRPLDSEPPWPAGSVMSVAHSVGVAAAVGSGEYSKFRCDVAISMALVCGCGTCN